MSARRLKIAFLVGKFPAISETFILNQITGLIDAGHHVDIFAKDRPDDAKVQPEVEAYGLMERTRYFKVPDSWLERGWGALRRMVTLFKHRKPGILRAFNVRAYGKNAASLRLLYLLSPLLEGGPYDIVHCHFGSMGLLGVQLKEMGAPGKLVVTFHGNDISKFVASQGSAVYRRVFEKADLLMPVSRFWKLRLIQMGADPARLQIHRMGIELDHFPFEPRSMRVGQEICLLTVGRLAEKKGITFALQAVARVAQRHPEWKIRYLIIGSGEQEEILRELIQELHLDGIAALLGSRAREEIHQHIHDSHIFLLPSIKDADGDQEGIPVSLMEAMAAGMPILSTRHTGIPELVQDGRSGFLVPERDVEKLAARLEHLVMHPERWPMLGLNGRRFVEANHDIHRLNHQLIEIYHSLRSGTLQPERSEPAAFQAPMAPEEQGRR